MDFLFRTVSRHPLAGDLSLATANIVLTAPWFERYADKKANRISGLD